MEHGCTGCLPISPLIPFPPPEEVATALHEGCLSARRPVGTSQLAFPRVTHAVDSAHPSTAPLTKRCYAQALTFHVKHEATKWPSRLSPSQERPSHSRTAAQDLNELAWTSFTPIALPTSLCTSAPDIALPHAPSSTVFNVRTSIAHSGIVFVSRATQRYLLRGWSRKKRTRT